MAERFRQPISVREDEMNSKPTETQCGREWGDGTYVYDCVLADGVCCRRFGFRELKLGGRGGMSRRTALGSSVVCGSIHDASTVNEQTTSRVRTVHLVMKRKA